MTDLHDAVRWCYRLFLGREAESDAIVESHASAEPQTLAALRQRFMLSDEFALVARQTGVALHDQSQPADLAWLPPDLAAAFFDSTDHDAEPGFFRDRFGVRTRCAFLPPAYAAWSGQVARPGGLGVMPLHEPAELLACLRAAQDARDMFAVVELGAGWGPWLVLGARLAARRGLRPMLLGVEGSSEHVGFMRTHLLDNGIDPREHQILHAVIGPRDGRARFPVLADPANNWGARACFGAVPAEAMPPDGFQEVICLSIATLMVAMPRVDLLHCDIQGEEAEAMRSSIDVISSKVRRVVIGTHSRAIEAKLLELFPRHHWQLEHEQPCVVSQQGDHVGLVSDGVQAWKNLRA